MPRTLLMAVQEEGGVQEAEPVVVDTDTAGVVVLELVNGVRVELDAREIRSALGEAA